MLRSDAPLHIGQLGTFSVLGFGSHMDLDVVYTEGLATALYVEDRDKIAMYRTAWQRLTSVAESAESAESSAALISEIRKCT